MEKFSHMDEKGAVKMVDVTNKNVSFRLARAEGKIRLQPDTIAAITDNALPKGNVLTTAKIAGIQAAKKTAELIPLCHQLNLSWVHLEFELGSDQITIHSVVKTTEATGVEMEALTAVATAALTIYDMCKAVDKTMTISNIHLVEKKGGKSDQRSDFSPKTAVLILSQSVHEGKSEDTSGHILKEGLAKYGCQIDHSDVIPDDGAKLKMVIEDLKSKGFELVVTSGGTGVGPHDVTIETIEPLLTQRLPGVEQALHSYGRIKTSTAILSRLLAGRIGDTFVICLPGSPGAAKDALAVLMPSFLHVFSMAEGQRH
jgi:molybdenum cofactor biosynthesis protein MoaC